MYIASSNHHLLATYDIEHNFGFNVIKSIPESTYTAITFRADQQMFGVPSTSANPPPVFWWTTTLERRARLSPSFPRLDQRHHRPLRWRPPARQFRHLRSRWIDDPHLLRGPVHRQNSVLTSSAPWPIGAIAYDGENQRIYYIRRSGLDVGVYSIPSATHSIAEI